MIEPIMYFGIGFLFASLIGLVLIPLVHNRATRLTVRRIEAATPVSLTEIQAEKDQLRAEFAMSTRRLEMSVDQLKARTTTQLTELGRKTEAIGRLKAELGEKSAAILALESHEKTLRDQVRALEEELEVKSGLMQEAAQGLAEKEAALAKLTSDLGDRSYTSDTQRVEIVALRTQVGALKTQIDHFEADVKAAESGLGRVRDDADSATAQLNAERGKAETLGSRLVQLERQLLAQTTESETLARRLQGLEKQTVKQNRILAERDVKDLERLQSLAASEQETNKLRAEIDAARRTETDLRTQIAANDERHANAAATLRASKALLEEELKRARDEFAILKRAPDAGPDSERAENALLRERISDIATEVARLTLALEGPGSPIEAILNGDRPNTAAVNGAGSTKGASGTSAAVKADNLADRIRALRTRAGVASPT